MSLANPDARRALRSIIQALVVLCLLALVWWITGRLKTDAALLEIARWSLIIIAIGTLGYILENGLRSVKASAWGASFDASTGDAPAAADAVAHAAVDKAEQIKGASDV